MVEAATAKQTSVFEAITSLEETVVPEKKSNKVDLLELEKAESVESVLELVRLNGDETAIILFTSNTEKVDLHYCSETEIQGYVICNGPDCLLCRIGRKRDQRLLLPVYLPSAGCVGILPLSNSIRPFALRPQVINLLKVGKPTVMFVTREGGKYTVSTTELQKDVDGGEAVIKKFVEEFDAGLHDLTAVYSRIDNEQLSNVEEIGRMMTLKGITRDAGSKRS